MKAEKRDKLMSRWRHWDRALKRLWARNITQGRHYGRVFFKVQVLDTCLRFCDSGVYEDPEWGKHNERLSQEARQKAEKHQLELVRSAKMLVNNL